ncbi:MAG: DUF86 domain-containing protein [Microcoleus vaginatus WJT46-NPBG5]|jgi:uncharacterized protein with HEPN domain|nr:DUF86 domain-containing protein [Microcoleus vaginatus WJT46-NPBG5]
MLRDSAALLDIARFAGQILELTLGMSREEFETDIRTQLAVLYEIAVLGEAVKRLSFEFRTQYPDIPWGEIAGMRDKVIHQYDKVKVDVVWHTIQNDVPALLAMIEPLLPGEEN